MSTEETSHQERMNEHVSNQECLTKLNAKREPAKPKKISLVKWFDERIMISRYFKSILFNLSKFLQPKEPQNAMPNLSLQIQF